jgi:hypothetical protein
MRGVERLFGSQCFKRNSTLVTSLEYHNTYSFRNEIVTEATQSSYNIIPKIPINHRIVIHKNHCPKFPNYLLVI